MSLTQVIVLAGGFSPERAVSLASAANVAFHLRQAGHGVTVVDISRGEIASAEEARYRNGKIEDAPTAEEMAGLRRETDILGLLQSSRLRTADLIFPMIHGSFGEDGRLQALLEAGGFPFVGSDYVGQALAMNKHLAKQLFVQNGVPTPPWVRLTPGEPAPALEYPVVVKPANAGSTIGMSICRGRNDLAAALQHAFAHDNEAVVEQFVAGREFTIGVLGEEPLAAGEIRTAGSAFFDYTAKYQAPQTQEIFPADLPVAVARRAAEIALGAHRALRLRHYSRVDFMLDEADRIFVLEANAIPGMTRKSLYPQSAAAAGLSFTVVCDRLCRMALAAGQPQPGAAAAQ